MSLDNTISSEEEIKNLRYMYKTLPTEYALFNFKDIKSPFILPLIFSNEKERNRIKELLITDGVYTPIHWDLLGFVPKKFRYEHQLSRKRLSVQWGLSI